MEWVLSFQLYLCSRDHSGLQQPPLPSRLLQWFCFLGFLREGLIVWCRVVPPSWCVCLPNFGITGSCLCIWFVFVFKWLNPRKDYKSLSFRNSVFNRKLLLKVHTKPQNNQKNNLGKLFREEIEHFKSRASV